MMTFELATRVKAGLESAVDSASAALKPFPRLPNGLTPDYVKFSPEYRQCASAYAIAFSALRRFNADYVKRFKAELREARRKSPDESPDKRQAAT